MGLLGLTLTLTLMRRDGWRDCLGTEGSRQSRGEAHSHTTASALKSPFKDLAAALVEMINGKWRFRQWTRDQKLIPIRE